MKKPFISMTLSTVLFASAIVAGAGQITPVQAADTKSDLEQSVEKDLKATAGYVMSQIKAKLQDSTYVPKYNDYTQTMLAVKAGVTDTDYLIYKQGGIDKFTFDKDGKPVGVDDILKPLREDKTYSHLFAEKGGAYTPKGGSGSSDVNPWAKETFNLTKQGEIYKNDPAKAKVLMQEAGITGGI